MSVQKQHTTPPPKNTREGGSGKEVLGSPYKGGKRGEEFCKALPTQRGEARVRSSEKESEGEVTTGEFGVW